MSPLDREIRIAPDEDADIRVSYLKRRRKALLDRDRQLCRDKFGAGLCAL